MKGARPPSLSGISLLSFAMSEGQLPFLSILRELHEFLQSANVNYAVIGGVAAVRNGATRTTGDIDILVRRAEWNGLSDTASFHIGPDWAEYLPQHAPVDALFSGDDWGLPFLLPDPEEVREWDEAVGAWFIAPLRLLELKAAVHLAKRKEYGEATAAKDLSDVVSLLEAHPPFRKNQTLSLLHPSVRELVASASQETEKRLTTEQRAPRHPGKNR